MEAQDVSQITQNESRRNSFDGIVRRGENGLVLEVNFFGMIGTFSGEPADDVLETMRSLLNEFESKAVQLDIEEGNHD